MWVACQLHYAYEGRCPDKLSDVLNLLAEPKRLSGTGFPDFPPSRCPVPEVTLHLLIAL